MTFMKVENLNTSWIFDKIKELLLNFYGHDNGVVVIYALKSLYLLEVHTKLLASDIVWCLRLLQIGKEVNGWRYGWYKSGPELKTGEAG